MTAPHLATSGAPRAPYLCVVLNTVFLLGMPSSRNQPPFVIAPIRSRPNQTVAPTMLQPADHRPRRRRPQWRDSYRKDVCTVQCSTHRGAGVYGQAFCAVACWRPPVCYRICTNATLCYPGRTPDSSEVPFQRPKAASSHLVGARAPAVVPMQEYNGSQGKIVVVGERLRVQHYAVTQCRRRPAHATAYRE